MCAETTTAVNFLSADRDRGGVHVHNGLDVPVHVPARSCPPQPASQKGQAALWPPRRPAPRGQPGRWGPRRSFIQSFNRRWLSSIRATSTAVGEAWSLEGTGHLARRSHGAAGYARCLIGAASAAKRSASQAAPGQPSPCTKWALQAATALTHTHARRGTLGGTLAPIGQFPVCRSVRTASRASPGCIHPTCTLPSPKTCTADMFTFGTWRRRGAPWLRVASLPSGDEDSLGPPAKTSPWK